MSLLDFLVTSETRKTLLSLLWADDLEATGLQLARLADTAYSSVHAELEAMKAEGVVSSQRVGRADVYSRNRRYKYKAALTALVGRPKGYGHLQDETIRLNLVNLGAPLAVNGATSVDLSPEEALARGLELARRDSTVARALPVAFAKQIDSLNFTRLEYFARHHNVLPVLGFFLDLTSVLTKNKKLHLKSKKFMDRRRKRLEYFFVDKARTQVEKELAVMNTPSVALKWNFLMNMGMDSFESLFRKNFPAGGTS